MSIKSQGGVFGRNPTFNDVTVEGDLSVAGSLTIGGSVLTGLNLQGNWNASTNTPDLTVLTPDAGQFWIVSVAGSTNLGGITNWTVGDWALYDGTGWQRVEGGTVDLSNGVTGTLAITNGGTGASTASTARTNLGSGTVGDNLFTATTALAAQQAMDTEVGVDVQPYDATILKSADIGVTVEAYDSTILKSADIGVTVEAYDSTILKSADIGVTVQGYDSTILNAADIGVTVEAYDATILKSADIGSTVQGYDADTAKYDDTTANFTGTLQNGGSNVVVDADIGSTVQAYDADTAKLDVAQTWTALQSFDAGFDAEKSSASVSTLNRTTDDGDIQVFEKDGTPVGSAGAKAGDLYIGTGNTAIRFADSASAIYPHDITTNSVRADAIDIGHPTYRFKKLYLSDNVVVASGKGIDFSATAGTGTSELLDDYEEGTWTPVYKGSTTDPVFSYSEQSGRYVKIGNVVYIALALSTSSFVSQGVGNLYISGLPYAASIVGSTEQDAFAIWTASWAAGNAPIQARLNATTGNTIVLEKGASADWRDGGSRTDVDAGSLGTGGFNNALYISGHYFLFAD